MRDAILQGLLAARVREHPIAARREQVQAQHGDHHRSDKFALVWNGKTMLSNGYSHSDSETAMADLKKQFEDAAKKALNLKDRPDNDTMLKLYALYKQGSQGDVTGEKPGFFDFVGVAKYEAWAKLKGTAQDAAQKQYVDLVKKLS